VSAALDIDLWPGADLFAAMQAVHWAPEREAEGILMDCPRCAGVQALAIAAEPVALRCLSCSRGSRELAAGLRERVRRIGPGLSRQAATIEAFLGAAQLAASKPADVALTCMANVEPQDVAWLWPGRLPAGMLAVFDGAPGAGKSSIVCDLAARITTGRPWPGTVGRREPRDVILLAHEDSAAHTVRPRLDVAGADVQRVHILDSVKGRLPRFPDDVGAIESAIRSTGASMLIVDPISAYIGEADLHRDNEVRGALTPLVGVAESTGAAIILIRHLRKSGGTDAIYRGLGSVAITALARTSMMLLRDPDDEEARVLTWPLIRVAPSPQSLRWRFGPSEPGKPAPIVWDEIPVDLTADEVLERAEGRARPESAGGAAEKFLLDILRDGPVLASEMQAQAIAAGINERTLKRARERLGVVARKQGTRWIVEPPPGRGTRPPTRTHGPDVLHVPLSKEEGQGGPDSSARGDVPLPWDEGQSGQEGQGGQDDLD
jgi:hypothetical protein